MSVRRYALGRLGVALFALYLVVTITFGFVALTPDPNVGFVAWQASGGPADESEEARQERVEEAIAQYRESRNLNDPVHVRYVRWMGNLVTFDWGESYESGESTTSILADALGETVRYVVPAMVVAVVGGVAAGVYGALNRGSLGDRLATGIGYAGFSLPNFWIGEVLLLGFGIHVLESGRFEQHPELWGPVLDVGLPAFVLGTGLLAGQLRYARAESLEYVGSTFVKLVRAKGAGPVRVARHVLRNAALPLVSLFFADLLAVLVVNVFVIEAVFGVQGFGTVTLEAILNRDLPIVIGSTVTVATIGIGGSFLQDVLYAVLDPRVDTA